MKTKLTFLLLTVALIAGQPMIGPMAQTVVSGPQPVAAMPPAPENTGPAATMLPELVALPPLVVTGRPVRPPPARPRHQPAPWEIAAWDFERVRMVLDATPRGTVSTDRRRPDSSLARVDLISLRW